MLDDGIKLSFLCADLLIELCVADGNSRLVHEARQHGLVILREGDAAAAEQVDDPRQVILHDQWQSNDLAQREANSPSDKTEARFQVRKRIIFGPQRKVRQQRRETRQLGRRDTITRLDDQGRRTAAAQSDHARLRAHQLSCTVQDQTQQRR